MNRCYEEIDRIKGQKYRKIDRQIGKQVNRQVDRMNRQNEQME